MRHSKIGSNESEFVKDKRKNHCAGCMNEKGYCSAQEVLMCWLRQTYLPPGEWHKAMMSDIVTQNVNDITDEINSRILDDMKKERKI